MPRNSPEELDRYRAWYTAQMKALGALGRYTQGSLLWENVEIAAGDPFSTDHIILKMVGDLAKADVTAQLRDPLYCYDIACERAKGDLDPSRLRRVQNLLRPWYELLEEA